MQPQSPPGAGPLESLRALGSLLVELLGTRAELAVVELREQGERRKEMLILGAVAVLFLALGLLLAALFVVMVFWDTHRLLAMGAVTLLYLAIAGIAFGRLVQAIRTAPPAFEATLRELAADRELLRGRHE